MFTNAFKSLLRFLMENGFPYKSPLYGNSQFATNCYTVVLYYRMFKYSLGKKISFATFGVSIDDFLRDTLVWATAYHEPYHVTTERVISMVKSLSYVCKLYVITK